MAAGQPFTAKSEAGRNIVRLEADLSNHQNLCENKDRIWDDMQKDVRDLQTMVTDMRIAVVLEPGCGAKSFALALDVQCNTLLR